MTLTLKRLKSDSTATSGYLSVDGKVMCFTLEDACAPTAFLADKS